MRVSVIGGSTVDGESYERARTVGRLCGERGHTVVCGGYGGVMEAACRGAAEAGGESVGILSGTDPEEANDYVTTPVVTGLGNARNPLVVLNGDGVVAVDGATGTLSELGHALDFGLPVAGLGTHDLSGFDGFEAVETPPAAVDSVERRS
jgi:hypothetical protein